MRAYLFIVAALVAVIVACGCTGFSSTQTTDPTSSATPELRDYTFTQTITYSDENATTVITKNKLTKTAMIDFTLRFSPPDSEFINKTWFYEFGTALTAGIMQMAFFNETALKEFNEQTKEWNSQEYTVQDDSPEDQKETVPGDNPLAGYAVQSVAIHLLEQGTEAKISDVVITGPDREDVSITYHL
jgi:hypothetical protein